jgi:quercetin dioxygenase-like cupin family protein
LFSLFSEGELMKKVIVALCLAALATMSALTISSAETSSAPAIVMPDSLKWVPFEGVPGTQVAVVWGDPTKPGPFIIRVKFVDGAKFPLHWHPSDERGTVLSGTLMFGFGDKVDATTMKALGPGAFIYIPAGVRHYAMAKGPAVIQISGMGPRAINFVK